MNQFLQGPLSLLSSRKAWIALVAIVTAAILLHLADITSAQFIDFVKAVVMAWIGSMAVEKSALYLGPYPNGKPKPEVENERQGT